MGLLVALNENLEAFGTLFLDDGESDCKWATRYWQLSPRILVNSLVTRKQIQSTDKLTNNAFQIRFKMGLT